MSAYNRLKENRDAGILDELTNSKITQMEYMVIFLNDQIYNASIVLEDILRKSNRYRHKEKMLFNEMKREIKKYNDRIADWDTKYVEMIADITSSLEEDIKPHLDIYSYQISQALLNSNITGANNSIIVQTDLLYVLGKMSSTCLEEIKNIYFNHTACYYTMLDELEIKNVCRFAKELSLMSQKKVMKNKEDIYFQHNPMVRAAFDVVLKKIWDSKLYNKAFENWE